MLSRLVSSLRQTLWLALAAIAFFSPMVLDVFCTDWHPFYGFSPNYPHIPASFPYDEPEHLLITAPRGKVALGLPAPKVRLTIDANSPRIIALELKGAPWPTAPPTETMTPYASATVPFHGEVTAWTTPAPTAEPALPLRCGKGLFCDIFPLPIPSVPSVYSFPSCSSFAPLLALSEFPNKELAVFFNPVCEWFPPLVPSVILQFPSSLVRYYAQPIVVITTPPVFDSPPPPPVSVLTEPRAPISANLRVGKASLQLKIDPGYTFEDLGTSATAVRGWTSLVLIALIITKLNKLFPGFLTNLVVLVVLAVVFSRQAG